MRVLKMILLSPITLLLAVWQAIVMMICVFMLVWQALEQFDRDDRYDE
jgi:hypothetical protein